MYACLLVKGLRQVTPPSHLQYVYERPDLLQLQRLPLHALPSVVQVQLTISRSAWGGTGPVGTAGLMVEPSILQPSWQYLRLLQVGHVGPLTSTVASDGELEAQAAADCHQ